jgi:hypothetical protein
MTDYHWTPANQRAFLEALAETGSIELACKEVSMSRRSVYNLCGRRDGAAFKIGCDAALLQARAVVWGTLMDRAINGQMVETVRDPETHTTRRMHYNGHMGLALLTRLEAKATLTDDAGPYATAVRMVDSDFAAFLDLIEAGGTGAQAGLFVAARITPEEMVFPGISDALENMQNQCELARISADCEDADDDTDPVQSEVDEMTVWYDDERQGWRTNFPPPPGFDGYDIEGMFGDIHYERELSPAEEDALAAKRASEVAPIAEAAAIARDSWFGFVPEPVEEKSARSTVAPGPQSAIMPAALATVEVEAREPEPAPEPEPEPEPLIEPDPNIRTIHCKPQPNYPAMGMIPPWAERIY